MSWWRERSSVDSSSVSGGRAGRVIWARCDGREGCTRSPNAGRHVGMGGAASCNRLARRGCARRSARLEPGALDHWRCAPGSPSGSTNRGSVGGVAPPSAGLHGCRAGLPRDLRARRIPVQAMPTRRPVGARHGGLPGRGRRDGARTRGAGGRSRSAHTARGVRPRPDGDVSLGASFGHPRPAAGGHVAGVIFHSDRGSTPRPRSALCGTHGVQQSMGKTGVCWDALAESFFATSTMAFPSAPTTAWSLRCSFASWKRAGGNSSTADGERCAGRSRSQDDAEVRRPHNGRRLSRASGSERRLRPHVRCHRAATAGTR